MSAEEKGFPGGGAATIVTRVELVVETEASGFVGEFTLAEVLKIAHREAKDRVLALIPAAAEMRLRIVSSKIARTDVRFPGQEP